jgi:Ca2+-binding EF-hand superfamily protein
MVSKKDFMAMMEKRFDMMDKKKIGRISRADVMAIFSDKP